MSPSARLSTGTSVGAQSRLKTISACNLQLKEGKDRVYAASVRWSRRACFVRFTRVSTRSIEAGGEATRDELRAASLDANEAAVASIERAARASGWRRGVRVGSGL